jgi:hypothetical protein
MENDGRFHVSRRGREVFAGSLDALEGKAREGFVGTNDLVFDPEAESWVFARNLPQLMGIDLPATPRDLGGRVLQEESETGEPKDRLLPDPSGGESDELEWEGDDGRRSPMLYVAIGSTVLMLALVVGAAMWSGGRSGQSLSRFLESEEGEGPEFQAPMDQAEFDEKVKAAQAEGGGQAAPGAGTPAGGPGAGAGMPGGPGAGVGTPGGPGAGNGMPGTPGGGAGTPGASGGPGGPEMAGLEKGQQKPLVFDVKQAPLPGVMVRPNPQQAFQYGTQYIAEAQGLMNPSTPAPGRARSDQLLLAVHQAEFAKLNLTRAQGFPGAEEALEQAKAVVAEAESAFLDACGEEESERFCELKLKYPHWNRAVLEVVSEEKAMVGMTTEQLRASWGRPQRLKREGNQTRFCYGQFCGKSAMIAAGTVIKVDDGDDD